MQILGFPYGQQICLPMQEMQETQVQSWVGKIPWSRKWQPAPVFLPGKFYGQRNLADYSLWGCKGSDTTEHKYANTESACLYIVYTCKFVNPLNCYSPLMTSDIWLIIFQRSMLTAWKKKVRESCLKLISNSKIFFLFRITSWIHKSWWFFSMQEYFSITTIYTFK